MDPKILALIAAVVCCCCCVCIIGGGIMYSSMSSSEESDKKDKKDDKASGTGTGTGTGSLTGSTNTEIKKFTSGSTKDTGYNDVGGGNSLFLDRHTLDCGAGGIQKFKFGGNSESKFRYDYTCAGGGSFGMASIKDTGYNDIGSGNIIFLDRHSVDCGKDGVVSKFGLGHDGTGAKIRYNYTCLPSKTSLTCRDVTTNPDSDGSGNSVFLDRHAVSCEKDEVLNSFILTRPGAGQIQYKYKCCKN